MKLIRPTGIVLYAYLLVCIASKIELNQLTGVGKAGSQNQWPYNFPARHDVNFTATFSVTVIPCKGEKLHFMKRKLAKFVDMMKPAVFTHRQVVIDGPEDRWKLNSSEKEAFYNTLTDLVGAQVLTRYIKVDYSDEKKERICKSFFEKEQVQKCTDMPHSGTGKGFYSYYYELWSCDTKYLMHFDLDIPVFSSGENNAMLSMVSLMDAVPQCFAAGYSLGIGDEQCRLNFPWTQINAAGTWHEPGFVTTNGFTTNAVLYDVERIRNMLKIQKHVGISHSRSWQSEAQIWQTESQFDKMIELWNGKHPNPKDQVHYPCRLPWTRPVMHFVGWTTRGPTFADSFDKELAQVSQPSQACSSCPLVSADHRCCNRR